jgi:hypothetical protein
MEKEKERKSNPLAIESSNQAESRAVSDGTHGMNYMLRTESRVQAAAMPRPGT